MDADIYKKNSAKADMYKKNSRKTDINILFLESN